MSRLQKLIDDALAKGEKLPSAGVAESVKGPWGHAMAHQPRDKDGPNKTEAAYMEHLDLLQKAGEIQRWWFHALKIRLAKATFWDTDFLVVAKDGTLEIHETKGYLMDDAAVKQKVCAYHYPFRVKVIRRAAKRDGGGWSEEVLNP